jgi:hypothetical protein
MKKLKTSIRTHNLKYLILKRHFPIAVSKLYYIFSQKSLNEVRNQVNADRESGFFQSIAGTTNQTILNFQIQPVNLAPSKAQLNRSIVLKPFNISNPNLALPIDTVEHLIGRITNNLYYFNFILNFFLYTWNVPKFRNILLKKNKKTENNQLTNGLRTRKSRSQLFN